MLIERSFPQNAKKDAESQFSDLPNMMVIYLGKGIKKAPARFEQGLVLEYAIFPS